ncbi:RING-H2 finger protein ATL19 [Pyrus ussuriensis x Pyrus communis]|uniref:RING-H2 finger protein ATL19 n=1 Tax=Pyrus ussuriensis x Pyrus communis TaxID=2448454 RepID=A0A5N5GQF8_9ROSA|nr:RING-H2 finger protein ATL19 [Pyrus ussuriensis x Pyrus communis]
MYIIFAATNYKKNVFNHNINQVGRRRIILYLFTQPIVLVYNMFYEAFVSEPGPPLFSELPTKIIACISIVVLLFLITFSMYIIYGPRINTIGSSPLQIAIAQNMQRLGVIKRLMPDFDEGRGPRLRALKKLPPLVNYGSCEIRSSRCTACAICLEDFADGDSCQFFSLCNHIFHSNCIDNWLMNKPTFPVCRNCIIDA